MTKKSFAIVKNSKAYRAKLSNVHGYKERGRERS
jgi:hypothetical protein